MKLIWLIILLVAIGCADDSPNPTEPVVVSDVATLIETLPASEELTAHDRPVLLYFDKQPLAVSVNGTPAKVKGNLVCWDFPNQDTGTMSLRIEWTNLDGTTSVAPEVWLRVAHFNWSQMDIVLGHISDGDSDIHPAAFNQRTIQFHFTKPAVGVMAKLFDENGNDFGWEAVWEDQTVKLQRGENGKLFEHGKRYMIKIVVDEAWIYKTDMCECMECSRYKNHEFSITFMTTPEDAK